MNTPDPSRTNPPPPLADALGPEVRFEIRDEKIRDDKKMPRFIAKTAEAAKAAEHAKAADSSKSLDPVVKSEVVEEKKVPRYVQGVALRNHGMGPRNLFWGVAMLFLAFVLLVVAVFLAGAKTMIYLVVCLATFTALFVLARLHVFQQRNGGFLALGMVCLIGTAFSLMEHAYSSAKNYVAAHGAASAPVVTLHTEEPDLPLLTQSFALTKPQGDGKQVRVLRDTRVMIGEKPFLIKAGDRFSLVANKGDEAVFAVRDLQLSLPSSEVELVDPAALTKGVGITAQAGAAAQVDHSAPPVGAAPGTSAKGAAKSAPASDAELAEITRNAQQEAMRRYPALAIKDSLENAVYISTYKQLREAGSEEFFSNPEWPIQLAELLAQREGWAKGGSPMTTGPAPVLDPPDNAADPAAPALPLPDAMPSSRPPAGLPPINSLDDGLPKVGRGRR